VLREFPENSGNLRRTLSLAENDLGHSHAQCAVMVHFGEAKVFERQVSQLPDSVIGREFPGPDFFEEFADGVSVHR
jgi:hypothetical protein